VLCLLLFLCCSDTGSDLTELSLVFSVGEDLETSLLLGLHGKHLLGILLVLLEHFLFSELVSSLVEDGLLLSSVKSLEVIGLYSMWSKLGLLASWVLSHERIGQSELLVVCCLELFFAHGGGVSISLLFCHLSVSSLIGDLHLDSLFVVLGLCDFEKLDEMVLLLAESIVSCLFLLLEELLLANLLGGPVGLL